MTYERTMDGKEGKASDFEVHNNIMNYHNEFLRYVDDIRRRGNLPKETLLTAADSIAEKMFLKNTKDFT